MPSLASFERLVYNLWSLGIWLFICNVKKTITRQKESLRRNGSDFCLGGRAAEEPVLCLGSSTQSPLSPGAGPLLWWAGGILGCRPRLSACLTPSGAQALVQDWASYQPQPMRVSPGIFEARTGKETSLPPFQAAGHQSAAAGGQLLSWGGRPVAENGASTQGSKTGTRGGQILGKVSKHLASAMLGPPLGYFNSVSHNAPQFS